MPRKTQRESVLSQIEEREKPSKRQAASVAATAVRRPARLQNSSFETYVRGLIPEMLNVALDEAPGQRDDNTNKAIAAVAFYRILGKACEKMYETEFKRLVEAELITDPKSKTDAGEYNIGSSSGFRIVSVVSQPRNVFDPNYIATELAKGKYKVPEHVTKQLCDDAKQPIGARQVITNIIPKTEAEIISEQGQGTGKAKARRTTTTNTPKPDGAQLKDTVVRVRNVSGDKRHM
jgi:hypothetical protein